MSGTATEQIPTSGPGTARASKRNEDTEMSSLAGSMRMKLLVRMILLGIFAGGVYSQTQNLAAARGQTGGTPDASGPADTKNKGALAQVSQTAPKLDEIIDRMIKREHDAIAAFDL